MTVALVVAVFVLVVLAAGLLSSRVEGMGSAPAAPPPPRPSIAGDIARRMVDAVENPDSAAAVLPVVLEQRDGRGRVVARWTDA